MRYCSVEDCNKPHLANDFCAMHNRRYRLYGDPKTVRMVVRAGTPEERLWAQVDRSGDGCWLWKGTRDTCGYGRISVNGRLVGTHRLSLSLALGRPLRESALHRCGVRACVRPDHLYEGTQADNMQDSLRDGTFVQKAAPRGAKHHLTTVSDEDVRDIRARIEQGQTQREVAYLYGLAQSTVSRIARRASWAHVE
jgi:hypothetical protein